MISTVPLHYRWLDSTQENALPIVLLHGLFGSMDNLNMLARSLQASHPIIQVDLRNHGLSPHTTEMDYPVMAADVLALLDKLKLPQVVMIGHSMGGKTAMAFSAIAPERLAKLIVIDIAPVSYSTRDNEKLFTALQAVIDAGINTRHDAKKILAAHINQENIITFLLKSFRDGTWQFNLSALQQHYPEISGWREIPAWPHPTLFIKGALSTYIQEMHHTAIMHQFPRANVHEINGSGHWVHAEKSDAVLHAIGDFLAS